MVRSQRHMLSESPDDSGRHGSGLRGERDRTVSQGPGLDSPKGVSSGFRAGSDHAGHPGSAPEARSPERSLTKWTIFYNYHKINDLDTKTHGWVKNTWQKHMVRSKDTCLETHGRKTHG